MNNSVPINKNGFELLLLLMMALAECGFAASKSDIWLRQM